MVRDLSCLALEELERHLLGEQDVTDGKMTFRLETEPAHTPAPCIELGDVQDPALVNAVSGARVATNDVEVLVQSELFALVSREVALQ